MFELFAAGGARIFVITRIGITETEIGLGYAYTRYDRYGCSGCGKKEASGRTHHYVGPTKAAINLVYVF